MAFHLGRSFGTAATAALFTLAGAVAGAQSITAVPPEDRRSSGEARSVLPSPPPVDSSVHRSRPGRRSNPESGELPAGRLHAWTAQALKDGEGRLVIDGAARVVKPGETVDGYVIRAVAPGRVVLEGPAPRPGQPVGPVLAVMTFDAKGRSRVGLIFESDPTPALNLPAPER